MASSDDEAIQSGQIFSDILGLEDDYTDFSVKCDLLEELLLSDGESDDKLVKVSQMVEEQWVVDKAFNAGLDAELVSASQEIERIITQPSTVARFAKPVDKSELEKNFVQSVPNSTRSNSMWAVL